MKGNYYLNYKLTERDHLILAMRDGTHDGRKHTQAVIAAVFGISPQRARQIEVRARAARAAQEAAAGT